MRPNHTLALLRAGRPAFGTWLQLHSLPASRLLAAQGLVDWMVVDFEHTPVDLGLASAILSTISDVSQGRVTPLARIARGTMDLVKSALDAGAQGVILPMVQSAGDVAKAVRFARFPPEGERGAGGLAPHLGFGISRPEYLRCANDQILFAVQIETASAVEEVEAILDVPGVDLCFIGPNDLHMALGCPPQFWSREVPFVRAVDRIRAACAERGVPLGTLCKDASSGRERLAEGYRFLGIGSDAHFLLTHCGDELGELRGLPAPSSWCDRVGFDGG